MTTEDGMPDFFEPPDATGLSLMIFNTTNDANALGEHLSKLLDFDADQYTMPREFVRRVYFTLFQAGMILPKVWEENQMFTEKIRDLAARVKTAQDKHGTET